MSHEYTRRDFLRLGTAATVAAGLPTLAQARLAAPLPPRASADACIFINLVGGPSQIDTFDPKPLAPSDVRGPFRPIATRVPGIQLSELFPKLAQLTDQFSLIRSLHHDSAPIHETGLQLLNTGRLFRDGPDWPGLGAVVAEVQQASPRDYERWVMMPYREMDCGIQVGKGLTPGWLQSREPTHHFWDEGNAPFEEVCFLAARYIEKGSRFVTINMFPTVFDEPSWDCHADRGSLSTDLGDYRDFVAPLFDGAFSQLLIDLEQTGLLARTLVVATGEFGRTPHPNANGGRDHWPSCWTALVAGGGVQGGRVIGASDKIASLPVDRPVTPQELVATIYHALGISNLATIPGPDGQPVRVIEAEPVRELF